MRTKLSPIVGGRIELLPVREGDRVRKGQLLMKLWNDDQQAQRALAQTQVATARQRVAEACAQATNAVREAERQTALREKGFVSPSREESARTDAQARQAACAAARADVAQFQAKVTAVGVEQGRTVLYAPFDGIVAKIVGEVGEYSTPSPPGGVASACSSEQRTGAFGPEQTSTSRPKGPLSKIMDPSAGADAYGLRCIATAWSAISREHWVLVL